MAFISLIHSHSFDSFFFIKSHPVCDLEGGCNNSDAVHLLCDALLYLGPFRFLAMVSRKLLVFIYLVTIRLVYKSSRYT